MIELLCWEDTERAQDVDPQTKGVQEVQPDSLSSLLAALAAVYKRCPKLGADPDLRYARSKLCMARVRIQSLLWQLRTYAAPGSKLMLASVHICCIAGYEHIITNAQSQVPAASLCPWLQEEPNTLDPKCVRAVRECCTSV